MDPTDLHTGSTELGAEERRAEIEQARRLAERYHLEFIDMDTFRIDQELFRSIPADLMLRYAFVPHRREGKSLAIVVSDPSDLPMIDELAVLLATPIKVTVGPRSAIESILKKSESSQRVLEEATESFHLQLLKEDENAEDNLTVERLTSDISPVIRLVDSTIYTAITAPGERHPHRDAGRCGAREVPDRRRAAAGDASDREAVSQLDHLAHQGDGRARHRREARPAGRPLQAADARQDDRLSRLDHAERARRGRRDPYSRQGIDQRAVHRAEARHPGLPGAELKRFRKYIAEPYGMVLVTGPTGSGKTTTLYAALSEIKSIEDKIITIEDPVEYQLRGVTQIPINEKKGLTFARGLRSILRHDPDKIMVGEIRDNETAQIAINSALTGHLVFTTVHANNVLDVLGRFLNMGVEAVSVRVGAQLRAGAAARPRSSARTASVPRRPRRCCSRSRASIRAIQHTFYEGIGCIECNGTGYKGRMAICELLDLTDRIRELILEKRPTSEIKKAARDEGMRFLRESAVERVMAGVTTLREINKVTFVE